MIEKIKFSAIEIVSAVVIVILTLLFFSRLQIRENQAPTALVSQTSLEGIVLPSAGIEIPIKWVDLGWQMIYEGVIDKNKFEAIYSGRGGLTEDEKKILYGQSNGGIKITLQNAGFWLNLFWALGLGNKNPILENGPMMKYNGDASGFASTGGWTLAKGDAMSHYSRHEFLALTSNQQALVERVSKKIYRPCCDNPTYFPDCNHGMAMLGLLELMAAQGVSESDMYKFALQVNSYWFPDTYLTLAKYFQGKGIEWARVNPQEVLGRDYSSASGYQRVLSEVTPQRFQGGGSCGV